MAGKLLLLCLAAVMTLTAAAEPPPRVAGPLGAILAAILERRACDDYEPKECPEQDGDFPVFLPDEDDCRRFYECSNGKPIRKDCSPGLHFDRWNHICDQPAQAGCEDCTFRRRTAFFDFWLKEQRQSGSDSGEDDVGGQEDIASSIAEDGILLGLRSAWLQQEGEDDILGEDDDDSGEDDDDSSDEDCPPEYDEKCPLVDGPMAVLLPNPDSCSSFVMCSNGVAYVIDCPEGLEFSLKTRVCDYPYRANCVPCSGGDDDSGSSSSSSSSSEEDEDLLQPIYSLNY